MLSCLYCLQGEFESGSSAAGGTVGGTEKRPIMSRRPQDCLMRPTGLIHLVTPYQRVTLLLPLPLVLLVHIAKLPVHMTQIFLFTCSVCTLSFLYYQ